MQAVEREIIGNLILDPDAINEVYGILKPEMFIEDFYRAAYKEILVMFDTGIKVNANELAHRLENTIFDADTIRNALVDAVNENESVVAIRQSADILIREFQTEQVKKMFNTPLLASNIDDTIGSLITQLEALREGKNSTSKLLADIVKENKDKYFNDNNDKKKNCKTGLWNLDEILGGLSGGDIYVIGARPAVGKSALATQILTNVARRGKKVGYFNLEMVEKQVYERLLARQSKIGLKRIKNAVAFLNDEEKSFNDANDELEKLNIVVSTGNKSDADIKAECRHQEFDLIVIDYLQLVTSSRYAENRRVEVGMVSRSLKNLAMELNVPIIILSQLNRKSENDSSKEPTMADLKESGDIEQDASVVMLMWNLADDPNYRSFKGFKVEKNRQGDLARYPMTFQGDVMEFTEHPNDTIEKTINQIKGKIKDAEDLNEYCPFE